MAARLFSVVLCPLFASRTSRISLFCFLLHWITRAPPRFPLRTPLLCFTLTSSLWSLSRGSRVTHDWLLSWWLTDYWSLSIVTSWFKRSASDSGSRSAVQPRSASGSQPPSHPEEGFSVSCWPPGLCGSESKCQHWMWPGAIELFGIYCLSWDRIDGITNHFLLVCVLFSGVLFRPLSPLISCLPELSAILQMGKEDENVSTKWSAGSLRQCLHNTVCSLIKQALLRQFLEQLQLHTVHLLLSDSRVCYFISQICSWYKITL